MKQKMSNPELRDKLIEAIPLILLILLTSGLAFWVSFENLAAGITMGVILLAAAIFGGISIVKRKYKPPQTCFVYCPGCKQDLISRIGVDGTKLHDKTDQGELYVEYLCGFCKTFSTWNFDSAPVPLIIGASTSRNWYFDEKGNFLEVKHATPKDWWTVE